MSTTDASDRATALADLVNLRVTVSAAIEAVRKLPWDHEVALADLDRRAAITVVSRFRTGALTADDLQAWADAIEGREDVGFEPGHEETLSQFVFETANPSLAEELTDRYAVSWIARLAP